MGAGRVLCDDVLRRRMRTCVLSVSSTVGRSIPALRLGTLVPRQKPTIYVATSLLPVHRDHKEDLHLLTESTTTLIKFGGLGRQEGEGGGGGGATCIVSTCTMHMSGDMLITC